MREVEIHVWCDLCGRGESAALTRVVAIDGAQSKALDLCETCDKALFSNLVRAVEEFGAEPQIVEPSIREEPATERTCPRCKLLVSSRQNLSRHCTRSHGVGLRELVRTGELAPVTIQRKGVA